MVVKKTFTLVLTSFLFSLFATQSFAGKDRELGNSLEQAFIDLWDTQIPNYLSSSESTDTETNALESSQEAEIAKSKDELKLIESQIKEIQKIEENRRKDKTTPNPYANLTKKQSDIMKCVTDLLNARDNDFIAKAPEDWKDLAKELKKTWDPKNTKSFKALYNHLNDCYNLNRENIALHELSKASAGLYYIDKITQKSTTTTSTTQTTPFTPQQSTIMSLINQALDAKSEESFSKNKKDWEEFVQDLKKAWDPKDEKSLFTLRSHILAIYTLDNQNKTLKNINLALDRLCNKKMMMNCKIHNKSLSKSNIQKINLMSSIKKLLENKNDFIDKNEFTYWEDLVETLKLIWDPEGKKTIHGLRYQLEQLSKAFTNETDIHKLYTAAQRLGRQKKRKLDDTENHSTKKRRTESPIMDSDEDA